MTVFRLFNFHMTLKHIHSHFVSNIVDTSTAAPCRPPPVNTLNAPARLHLRFRNVLLLQFLCFSSRTLLASEPTARRAAETPRKAFRDRSPGNERLVFLTSAVPGAVGLLRLAGNRRQGKQPFNGPSIKHQR